VGELDDPTPLQPPPRSTRSWDGPSTPVLDTNGKRPCLVILAGPRLGELVAVEGRRGLVIGRDPLAELHLQDPGVSRRHARISVEGDPPSVRLYDLESTNGTWVDGERIAVHTLRPGDKFRVGQTTVVRFVWHDPEEEQRQRALLDSALRDELTRVFNGRYLVERLGDELGYAARHASPLALLLIDVDRFEQVNELFGRAAGDALLGRLAEVILSTIRAEDVLARLKDDTFAIVGRDTGLDGGARLGERLRAAIAEVLFSVDDVPVELRVSIGVSAVAPPQERSLEELLARAESGLRLAKQRGRNRVAVEPTETEK
jgi:diguanylate cyclase (GGDEF)-like protein